MMACLLQSLGSTARRGTRSWMFAPLVQPMSYFCCGLSGWLDEHSRNYLSFYSVTVKWRLADSVRSTDFLS